MALYGQDDAPICFEGPEKRLEVDFFVNPTDPIGLRAISQERWQEMLDLAKCTIISRTSNEHFDSFVLSESSLFVYPYKVMLKTCGTTTLLRCVHKLIEYGAEVGLSIELLMFSRKNLTFPDQQHYPHADFKDEVTYLNQYFEGSAYVIGPVTDEHWYLYLADFSEKSTNMHETCRKPEETMEIMMHDLDRAVAQTFYRRPGMTTRSPHAAVGTLVPGSTMDEYNFEPCGYSMNGLLDDKYYTIHVTPEPQASFASFETNISATCYRKLAARVISVFKPATATITLFLEKHRSKEAVIPKCLEIEGYKLRHRSFSELEGNCDLTMWNYVRLDAPVIEESIKRRKVASKSPVAGGSP